MHVVWFDKRLQLSLYNPSSRHHAPGVSRAFSCSELGFQMTAMTRDVGEPRGTPLGRTSILKGLHVSTPRLIRG